MSDLQNIPTDDLVQRWSMLLTQYATLANDLSKMLSKVDFVRQEMNIIREELSSRNIKIDET